MKLFPFNFLRAAAVAITLPVVGMCAAVQINGVCVNGNCTTPNTISYLGSESGSSNNGVTLTGDPFNVSSTFNASYGSNGTNVNFYPVATYLGSANLTHTDTITVDLLTSYYDNGPGTWNGTYTEHVPLTVAANSIATGELFVSIPGGPANGLGLVGCVGAASCPTVTDSATLTGLTGNTLNYDYQFVFTFTPGVTPGSSDSSTTPEPAQMIPAGLSLVGFALVALRRRKQ